MQEMIQSALQAAAESLRQRGCRVELAAVDKGSVFIRVHAHQVT